MRRPLYGCPAVNLDLNRQEVGLLQHGDAVDVIDYDISLNVPGLPRGQVCLSLITQHRLYRFDGKLLARPHGGFWRELLEVRPNLAEDYFHDHGIMWISADRGTSPAEAVATLQEGIRVSANHWQGMAQGSPARMILTSPPSREVAHRLPDMTFRLRRFYSWLDFIEWEFQQALLSEEQVPRCRRCDRLLLTAKRTSRFYCGPSDNLDCYRLRRAEDAQRLRSRST